MLPDQLGRIEVVDVSFDRLLPHFCTIQSPGKVIGEDRWGRPIYEPNEPKTSSCRFIEETISNRDNTGSDVIKSIYLFLPKTTAVDSEMTVSNIIDDEGNLITTAKLVVDRVTRQTARKRLHHFKVYLKGAE